MELGLLISPGCQRGESSGLLTRIAPTETVSLGAADEKLTAFLDLEESHAMTVIEVKPHCWAVFRELGSVVTVEPKWSLVGVFPSRAVFKLAARQETRCDWPLRQFIIICHCRV